MKVLVCIPCLMTGGTEIQTLSLVEALVDAGHQVDVACYFEHTPDMSARYRAAGAQVHLLSPDGSRPAGVRAVAALLFRGLRRVVRDVRPDVAHVQYMAPGAIPILILRLLGVRRIVATAHTAADIYSPRGLKLLRWLNNHILCAFQCITLRAERSFFGTASLLTPETEFHPHANHFTIYNNLPSSLRPLCVDSQAESEPSQDCAARFSARFPSVVGVVSRLELIKGMDLVLPAFARALSLAQNDNPDAAQNGRLLVVGDGSQRAAMEAQARELGLEDRVEFLGRQPQSALSDCYDKIDILLMPSRSEGFGLTAVEGMARGCVPVVAEVGGLPEVVRDGVDGLLHKPEDVEDLAAKIAALLADPARREALRQGAIRRAADFTHEAYNTQIRLLYNRLP